MFFTNMAGIFAGFSTVVGVLLVGFGLIGLFTEAGAFAAGLLGGGFSAVLSGCLIGVLVEISSTLNEIKKAGRAK